jgi:hypothetical protein
VLYQAMGHRECGGGLVAPSAAAQHAVQSPASRAMMSAAAADAQRRAT